MIWLRKNWRLASALAVLGSAAAALLGRVAVARVVGVPVHYASHQLCSASFVAGLDPTDFFNEAIKPKLGPLGALLRYEVDRERQEVRTSLAGLVHSRAVHDGPFGCRVLHLDREASFSRSEAGDPEPPAPSAPSPFAGPEVVAPVNAKLSEVLDHAFAESESGPRRFTKAVLVLHRGRVVGERYAAGITPATPLLGFSMTKSVTNALLGILVRKGMLDMKKPAPIAEWSKPGDPRQPITPDQMLRMVSGIRCGQSLKTGFTTIFDADTQMEFDMADQSAFAASAGQRAAPGSEWRYTNCNFVLLSRIIRNLAGGDAKSARRFITRELFESVGFEHATLEYDSAGVPLGTIHLWASARDWARLGLLYLRDGVAESGRRILPEGWVDYSAELTPQSADEYGYGAGFWTQRGNSAAARERVTAGMPADSFMALGAQGQYTIVIPSEDLVIVKIGWAYTPDDDRIAVARLVKETIAALQLEE
jgi:CubicO group peptidase (beta-lactamase class C family)